MSKHCSPLHLYYSATILANTPFINDGAVSSEYFLAKSTTSFITTLNGVSVYFISYIAKDKIAEFYEKGFYVEKDVNKAIEMYKENDTFISRFALERLKVK